MSYIMHTNHVAWCALSIVREGGAKGDARAQFFGSNSVDFYKKDMGTVLPSLFFLLANLGCDPRKYQEELAKHVEVWGSKGIAEYMWDIVQK